MPSASKTPPPDPKPAARGLDSRRGSARLKAVGVSTRKGGRHRAEPASDYEGLSRLAGEGRKVARAGAGARGKTVTGRASAGAVGGAMAGAGGGPAGIGAGAVLGGAAGGWSAHKERSAAARASRSGATRLVIAEFLLCMVILALSPITDKHRDEAPGAWMKRASALMGLFFVLGLLSTAGRGGARAAAGFGGLVTVVLALSDRDVFAQLAGKLRSTGDAPAGGTAPDVPDVDEPVQRIGQPRPRPEGQRQAVR